MIDQLKPLLGKLALFSQERLGFKHPPKLFLRNDPQNSQQALGKTAFYNPQEQSVTLFIHGRHPKDILRSFTHELVHHCQNERGDLTSEKMGEMGSNYAQDNDHMRKMEQEAYLEGNMCFRDWEDTIEDKYLILIKLAESKFLKENKTMTTKITKEFLKETIRKVLAEQDEIKSAIANLENASELQGTDTELSPEELKKRIANTVIAALKSGSAEDIAQAEKMLAKIKAEMVADKKQDVRNRVKNKTLLKFLDGEEEDVAFDKEDADKAFANSASAARSLEEGGCGAAPGKRCDDRSCSSCYSMEEANELEEAKKCPKCGAETKMKDGKEVCGSCDAMITEKDGKRTSDCKCEKKSEKAEGGFPDLTGDGQITQADILKGRGVELAEDSKIQTPEQENALYESRFAPKNNRLFEKLVKEWTK